VIAFLLLAFIGVPVGFAMAMIGCAGVMLVKGPHAGLSLLGTTPWQWVASVDLICVPLFILMGQFSFHSGITRDAYEVAYKWMGKFSGGLSMATILGCSAFAACTGSPVACASTMGMVAYPQMNRFNYDRKLSVGCICGGGTLGILIPPSIPMVIYGFIVYVSISDLFVAGILPGLILTGLFIVTIAVICARNPKLGPRGESFSWREKFLSLKGIWCELALFAVVIGGLYLGIFAPSEAGAVGAFSAFAIASFRGTLTARLCFQALKESLQMTCMIFILIIGAMIFNIFVTVSGAPKALASLLVTLPLSPIALVGLIILMYIPMGMVLDALAMVLLTVPVFAPIVSALGFDLVWFGVVIILVMQVGLLTPPVGMVAYVINGVTGVPLDEVFRGCAPFIIAMLIMIILLVAFPQIVLFLPHLMK
jgi:tripartite ATP-independent transporter DctM subunit